MTINWMSTCFCVRTLAIFVFEIFPESFFEPWLFFWKFSSIFDWIHSMSTADRPVEYLSVCSGIQASFLQYFSRYAIGFMWCLLTINWMSMSLGVRDLWSLCYEIFSQYSIGCIRSLLTINWMSICLGVGKSWPFFKLSGVIMRLDLFDVYWRSQLDEYVLGGMGTLAILLKIFSQYAIEVIRCLLQISWMSLCLCLSVGEP